MHRRPRHHSSLSRLYGARRYHLSCRGLRTRNIAGRGYRPAQSHNGAGQRLRIRLGQRNRRHYEMAAEALGQADKNWLRRLITRRLPLERWSEALEHRPGRHQGRNRLRSIALKIEGRSEACLASTTSSCGAGVSHRLQSEMLTPVRQIRVLRQRREEKLAPRFEVVLGDQDGTTPCAVRGALRATSRAHARWKWPRSPGRRD